MYQLGGICKLVDLLRSPNQNVQQAAAGALRNLVFRSVTNKLETRRQGGIREAVGLLKRTGNAEIQKQLTGREPGAVGGPRPRPRPRRGAGRPRLLLTSWMSVAPAVASVRASTRQGVHYACPRGVEVFWGTSGQGWKAGVQAGFILSRPWVFGSRGERRAVGGRGTHPGPRNMLSAQRTQRQSPVSSRGEGETVG